MPNFHFKRLTRSEGVWNPFFHLVLRLRKWNKVEIHVNKNSCCSHCDINNCSPLTRHWAGTTGDWTTSFNRHEAHIYSWQLLFLVAIYVSTAHETEIHTSTVTPSGHPLSVSQLSLTLLCEFLSSFSCCWPWAIHYALFWKLCGKKAFTSDKVIFPN